MVEEQDEAGNVTRLIQQSAAGDEKARHQLLETMYGDLRRLAAALMAQERPGHTLQPTALVNELMMKMLEDGQLAASSRQHLLATGARAMRHLLVDHARAKRAAKRGDGIRPLEVNASLDGAAASDEKLLMISDAMDQLESRNERQAKVAEMKIFGGFTMAEIAEALAVNTRTVERDWAFAQAWLQTQLR